MILLADIPSEVMAPYVLDIYKEFKDKHAPKERTFPGISRMSEAVKMRSSDISDIITGKKSSVSLTVCDKLSLFGSFNLNEITEDAIEWAKEHPEINWPEDFMP